MPAGSSIREFLPSRLHFSLRWKVLGVLSLIFAAAFAGFGYNQYQTLHTQYQLAAEQRLETNRRALSASLRESAGELQQLINQWGASLQLDEFETDGQLGDMLPPQLSLTLDALAVYNPAGRVLGEWSVGRDSALQPLRSRDSIARAFTQSRPVTTLGCVDVCYQHSFVPVITADNQEIVVAATRSILGAIASFSRLTGDNVALVAGAGPAADQARSRGPQRLVAVTNAAQMQTVAMLAEQQMAAGKQPGPFNVENNGQRFLVNAMPLAENAVGQPIHALVMMDVSAALRAIESAVLRSNLLAGASLIAGLLIVLALLTGPLTRLRNVASALPRLPARQFPEAMALISHGRREHYFTDETDVLRDTAVDLIEQLQLLRHAEDASRAKSEFLATMSHEIRTPLSAVISLLELHSQSRLTAAQQRMVGTARESAEALLTVINDILDMSKVEAGKLELEHTEFRLHKVVEAVIDGLTLHAHEKGLYLHCHIDPAIPTWQLGDPLRMRQILFNLVGNAIKFSSTGEITVEARHQAVTHKESHVLIEVQDQGIGIEPSLQQEIFSPFTQAEKSTTRNFGGTGLGLTICRRLVELMGGEIGVRSAPGDGACFWFRIPLQAAGATESLPSLSGIRLRACLQSDFEYRTLASYLEDAGAAVERHALVSAAELPEALRQMATEDVDAVFCEHGHGLRPARATDQLRYGNTQPLALITTRTAENKPLPVMAWLSRPLHRDALIESVGRAFERTNTPVANPRSPDMDAQAGSSRIAGRHILAVEDNPTNAMVIKLQLESLGTTVILAANGREALAKVRIEQFDAVVTDLHMPEMDGYELAREIRRLEHRPDAATNRLSIVALSASTVGDGEAAALAAGMDAFLHKPASLEILENTLSALFSSSGQGSAPRAIPAENTDLQVLDNAVLAACVGDNPMLQDAIRSKFTATLETGLGELRRDVKAGNSQAVADNAHKLRGSARTVGAGRLAVALGHLEMASRSASSDSITAAFATAESEHQLVREKIETKYKRSALK